MSKSLALTLMVGGALIGGPAQAQGQSTEPKAIAEASSTEQVAPEEAPMPMPAKLIEFDGGADFLRVSQRLRVIREAVQFDLTVGDHGEPTDCQVINRFRQTFVNLELCKVAMAHYHFEPARNAQNEAIEGSYRARLSYAEIREALD